jgi:hypothetical protein
MRPTSYDQRQIDDEYSKDRMREAELARLALEARVTPTGSRIVSAAWTVHLLGRLGHLLASVGKTIGALTRAARDEVRHWVQGATYRPRHT